jgi:hypothetical protein
MLRCASSWPPLLQKKASHRFRLCLVSLFESRSIPRLRNQFFPQSFDFLVSNLVPLRFLPLFLSRLRFVFVSISTSTSYRRYTLQSVPSSYVRSFQHFRRQFFNSYHLAFVNALSYSVITFNLFSTRFFNAPTHPPLLVSSPIVTNRHRSRCFSRRGDRAWRGGT